MRGNSNAPAKGKIEMRCKAMSAEQDGREATTLRRHPGILQPNYFKQLQKQRSGSAVVPFAVPANDLQQGLGRAIIIAFRHHAAGQFKSRLMIVRIGCHPLLQFAQMPEGPPLYPDGELTDEPE